MNRRDFIKRTSLFTAAAFVAPTIVKSSSLFGPGVPSERINIGVIGTGRQGRVDMSHIMRNTDVRITAVCDLDRLRMADAVEFTETSTAKATGTPHKGVKMYADYRELLEDGDIDAVLISTPDHQHARLAIDAAWAGKDIYLEKPAALTVCEGRLMSNAVNATGRIFQTGSQQRSGAYFRRACELVRSGRIGRLHTVEVRLPGDPPGGDATPMEVPAGFDYDAWLGSTPWVPYTVDRVHPQAVDGKPVYSRPGWLRCEQFGAGMITGWGSHHFDIAHWAMDTEYTGPLEVEASAVFPAPGSGLWNVHGAYHSRMLYANGVVVKGMEESAEKPNGVLFVGDEGWIFVSRGGERVTDSDPVRIDSAGLEKGPLSASDAHILRPPTDADVHLYESDDHFRNWIESMRSRRPAIAPAEPGHRSCSVCLLQQIAMHLGRKLRWDARRERFIDDDQANSMLSRPQRAPYQI